MPDKKDTWIIFPLWLLNVSSIQRYNEHLRGDCEEMFYHLQTEKNIWKARRWLWKQALKSSIPFLMLSIYRSFQTLPVHIKISYRQIASHKAVSLVNILGLALGFAIFILVSLYAKNEFSYDQFHADGEDIYRVGHKLSSAAQEVYTYGATIKAGPLLKQEFPEVTLMTRLYHESHALIIVDNKPYLESGFMFADTTFFTMFNFPLTKKLKSNPISTPNSIVVTEETAKKYFGNDALGKTITLKQKWANFSLTFTVTGIAKNVTQNSHIAFNFIAPMKDLENVYKVQSTAPNSGSDPLWMWDAYIFNTYIKLAESSSKEELKNKFGSFADKYYLKDTNRKASLVLTRLSDIHTSKMGNGPFENDVDIDNIYILLTLGTFILIIASINSMNLSTAKSIKRGKEVGMRKVLGSGKVQIVQQYLLESISLSGFSLLTAIFFVVLFLPGFNSMVNRQLSIIDLLSTHYVGFLLAVTVGIGILSSCYPAFILSSIMPVQAMKEKIIVRGKKLNLQKYLVVFQFVISIILIGGTLIIKDQIAYMFDKDLGFNKNNVIFMNLSMGNVEQDVGNYFSFKNELAKLSGVEAVSEMPAGGVLGGKIGGHRLTPAGNSTHSIDDIDYIATDSNFLRVFNIKLLHGKSEFTKNFNDVSLFLNQVAVKRLLLDDPIGKKIYVTGSARGWTGTVRGIISDFNYETLKRRIGPLIVGVHNKFPGPELGYVVAKLDPRTSEKQTIASIEKKWSEFYPQRPFTMFYLDENFEKVYVSEKDLMRTMTYLSGFGVFIACLGLLGLIGYSLEIRMKEIGIRKVLGAKITDVIIMLCKEAMILILCASVIAYPFVYLSGKDWLRNFAFRIEISSLHFILPTIIIIVIALITVSRHALKAGFSNPVKTLYKE